MSEITFPKDDLQAMAWDEHDPDEYTVVERTSLGRDRWSENIRMVFAYDDEFYATTYSEGLTEMQDEAPYDYCDEPEPGRVAVQHVVPVEVLVTKYVEVE